MGRAYKLVIAFAFCLVSRSAQAYAIDCDLPDLGLANPSATEEINAMLQQATACVQEKKPGRAVAILTQVIKSDHATLPLT